MTDLWQKIWLHKVLVLLAVIILSLVAFGGWVEYRQWQVDRELKAAMESIEVPAEWKLKEESYNGNLQCLDACRSFRREYRLSSHDTVKQDALNSYLEKAKTQNFVIESRSQECNAEKFGLSQCSFTASFQDYTYILSISSDSKSNLLATQSVYFKDDVKK